MATRILRSQTTVRSQRPAKMEIHPAKSGPRGFGFPRIGLAICVATPRPSTGRDGYPYPSMLVIDLGLLSYPHGRLGVGVPTNFKSLKAKSPAGRAASMGLP